MTRHCTTCTCSQYRTDTYCDSEATLGHETFGCLEKVFADGTHPLPHRGQAIWDDPCPECGGYEEHSQSCSDTPRVVDQTKPLVEVQWDEDGVVTLTPFDHTAYVERTWWRP